MSGRADRLGGTPILSIAGLADSLFENRNGIFRMEMSVHERVRALAGTLAVSGILGLAGATSAEALTIQRVGVEFQANTTFRSYQEDPTLATFPNGGFAVAWTDFSGKPPDSSTTVRARCFAHTGRAAKPDFVVPTTRTGTQREPSATGLLHGGFVVLWTDDGDTPPDTSYAAVRGQRYSNACNKAGAELLVNKGTLYDQDNPAVAALPNGGFVAAFTDWSGLHGDDHTGGITAQNFSGAAAGLVRSGAEARANRTVDWAQEFPSVAGLSTGNSAIAWTDYSDANGDTSYAAIRSQVIGPSGAWIGPETVVNTTTTSDQISPAAASLGRGKYVVVWEDHSQSGLDPSGFAVRGQVVALNGPKVGRELLVPALRSGDQKQPAVAGFPNGRFIVVWCDAGGDGSESGLRAQLFSPDGRRLGSEFWVNARKTGAQETPAVATFDNNSFVVVWTDWSLQAPDTEGAGVRGQVFRIVE